MKRTVALAILAALLLTLCACGKVRQAEEAIDAIGNVTAESGAQIKAAEAAVEALNDKQRDKLPNLTVLEEAQTEYETVLEEQAETEACVQEAENAIDAIGSVTLDSGDAIRAARAAYDAVPEEAREQVTNRETLSAAEQTFDALAIQATTDAMRRGFCSMAAMAGKGKSCGKPDCPNGTTLPAPPRMAHSVRPTAKTSSPRRRR